ncbi:hypothetical protein JY651_51120 [Pyxidicoccus parkwayensis]|uniref:Uncharacterized protein n=1 Tax=Pyxidicoccus parkwayensis TaxID=2813578 RepID=A0ABX7NWT3_9BACT|nr:hypothetical protein [Pyxidicoccus parkwaysis]QSQ23339.1 hypothetical protein JY651_51120 [Pyxidicoccus parkwaysis]
MSNGKRRAANPGRSDETRVAPEVDVDETRDIPLLTRPEETRMAPLETGPLETRMSPLEGIDPNATRMGPVEDRPVRGGKGRGSDPAADVPTDIQSAKPVGKAAAKPTGWLAKGGGKEKEKAKDTRSSPAPEKVGVVRLNPLEPAKGKGAAEEEAPALRTMFANHSALLAEELRRALASKMYGRGPHRVLRIDEPEGPSTAGGKLARQAISLVPRKGNAPSLICGWVDVSKREAQLRNFEGVAKRYESHHGEPLEMAQEEYERFLNDVEDVLIKAVIKVRVIVPEEQGAVRIAPPTKARKKGVSMVWVLAVAVLAFALGMYVGRMPH